MFELKRALKEKPEKEPSFSPVKGVQGSLVIGSDVFNIYNFLNSLGLFYLILVE